MLGSGWFSGGLSAGGGAGLSYFSACPGACSGFSVTCNKHKRLLALQILSGVPPETYWLQVSQVTDAPVHLCGEAGQREPSQGLFWGRGWRLLVFWLCLRPLHSMTLALNLSRSR